MLESSDKDFKEAITKMLQKVRTNYLEIHEKIESFRKETEDVSNKWKFTTEKHSN